MSLTIAAMHAVFSGVYGFKNGVNSYWSSTKYKKELYKTLPKYLKDVGYTTYGDSINKLILPPDGFDELKIPLDCILFNNSNCSLQAYFF